MKLDLSALDDNFKEETAKVVSVSNQDIVQELGVETIVSGRYQPRTIFNSEKLNELADSIKVQGVLQPIVVRPIGTDQFEIIAGERRWRASKLAGLNTIPAICRDIDDRTALAVALVENIQREGLQPMEEAISYQRLKDEFKLKNKEVAEAVGKPVNDVNKLLSLLKLAPCVLDLHDRGFQKVEILVELNRAYEENPEGTQALIDGLDEISLREVREFRAKSNNDGSEKNSSTSFSGGAGGEDDSEKNSSTSFSGGAGGGNPNELEGESGRESNKDKVKTEPEPDTGELTSWPKGKAIADPDRLKKPLLLVDYEGRTAAILLNRKPKTPGVVYIRYEDGGGDELVSVEKLKITQLSDE